MSRVRRALKRLVRIWVFAVLVVLGTGGGALYAWFSQDHRVFLPGRTTYAHHQIEMACHTCHTPFEGVKQDTCLACHAEQLRRANDTHPVGKFAAPTAAQGRDALDATRCITCHKEHAPRLTRDVAVTQPANFCVHCHADVTKERPSHGTFAFTTCASAGCHNYHDNTALNEEALAAGRGAPALLPRPLVLPTGRQGPRASRNQAARSGVIPQWESSAHARAAVNCPKCHEVRDATSVVPRWVERPGHATCATCHEHEARGFLAGHHGMRLSQGLSPMRPAMARLLMKADAPREVTCASCHGVHVFDTRRAAVDGCLSCHDDDHSRAYLGSPHAKAWRAEMAGEAPAGSGVSCATCHLPRGVHVGRDGRKRVLAEHNQDDNLRPVTKMLGTVCLNCHGMAFALDALADRELARKNYTGRPARHVESIDMVDAKLRAGDKKN